MNIFMLDEDPALAASYMCDIHVVKMILESCQMLSAAINSELVKYPRSVPNHPSTLWVKQSSRNYFWLLDHTRCLLREYNNRYHKVHAYDHLFEKFYIAHLSHEFPSSEQTPITLVMPEKYMSEDPIASYRRYYYSKQFTMARPMKWYGSPTNYPKWWSEQ